MEKKVGELKELGKQYMVKLKEAKSKLAESESKVASLGMQMIFLEAEKSNSANFFLPSALSPITHGLTQPPSL